MWLFLLVLVPLPKPPRYLLYRVLEALGPYIVGTWGVRVRVIVEEILGAVSGCLRECRAHLIVSVELKVYNPTGPSIKYSDTLPNSSLDNYCP